MLPNSIEIFPWNDLFNTGLPELDLQHRQLVQLLNVLASHVAFNADAALLGRIFDELAEHAAGHFQTEEAIWHSFLDGGAAEVEHQTLHRALDQEVLRLKASLAQRPLFEVAEEILSFLAGWLVTHILDGDHHMVRLMVACQQGLPLAVAQQRVQEHAAGADLAMKESIRGIYATLAANTLHLMRELAEHRKDKEELLRSRRALQESEANLQAFFDTIDDFLFVLDYQGRILQVNQTVVRRLGYPEAELVGASVLKVHPADRQEDAQRIMAEMLAGTTDLCQIPLLTAEGQLISVDTRVAAGQWNGQPALFGVSRDVSERVRAEAIAAKQTRLLEQYFDHALIALALLDRDFQFVRVNQVYAKADGRQVEDFPGHNHLEFYPSDARALFEEVVRSKQPFQAQARPFQYADHPERGTTYWDMALMPLLDARGEVEHLLLSLHDVTEQKRAEQVIRESAARYRSLVDHLPMLVWQKDTQGAFVTCNKAYAAEFGRTPEEMIGHTDFDFYPPELAARFREVDERIMAEGTTDVLERAWPMEGQPRWLRSTKLPLVDDQGKVYGTLGFAQDISERRNQEAERDQTLALLQTVIEHVPERIFWKDRDLKYLGCNPLFARDAGKPSPAQMVGKDDYQMGWAHQADLYRTADRSVIDSGKPLIKFEEPQTTPDGRTIWIRTSKVPLRNSKGEIFGVLGMYDDITAQKRAGEQVREQLDELRRWQEVMLDREDRLLDLKREVNDLLARLGEPPRYASVADGKDKP